MSNFVHAVYEVARKEVMQHIRTKRLLIIGVFFFVVLQLVTLVIPLSFGLAKDAPTGDSPAHENIWFYFHLNASIFGGLFAIQLLCIVLTADAICSEWGQRTIFLLLSKPVSRTAFVVGKYLGSVASIMPLVAVIYTVQYLLMMALFPGQPSGEEVRGFFVMLLMLAVGVLAVSAVALLFSTLTKSNVMSLILTLLSIFILFPILGAIGDITYGVDQVDQYRDPSDGQPQALNATDWKYDWSHYVVPTSALSVAPSALIPSSGNDDFRLSFSLLLPQHAPARTWLALVSGVAFAALFVGLSVARVNRRNFE
jgi:ABC-type transport system involved in multi-copper enzyme maturation permease subunit